MRLEADGLVIREQNIGESDRLITLLTRQKGIVRAFVRGARRIKSTYAGATQLLCYSRFSIYMGKEKNVIDEAEPINVFFDLRKSVEALTLGQYFAELSDALAPREDEAEEILRTVLNALYLLCKGTKPQKQIKAVTELRLLCAAGYMPDIVCCEKCGAFETPTMYFDCRKPVLYCQNCGYGLGKSVSLGVITAMRHICYSETEKIFNFSMPDESLRVLSATVEEYLLTRVRRRFYTLEFYNTITSDS